MEHAAEQMRALGRRDPPGEFVAADHLVTVEGDLLDGAAAEIGTRARRRLTRSGTGGNPERRAHRERCGDEPSQRDLNT
ncbi:hypothetical protein [Sorangium sp. So ce362]|uniref:hypothetical protein n=1 Tax=Sorangium sp. So ce362 TaxID=3133303 RepID=UPI003F5E256B